MADTVTLTNRGMQYRNDLFTIFITERKTFQHIKNEPVNSKNLKIALLFLFHYLSMYVENTLRFMK